MSEGDVTRRAGCSSTRSGRDGPAPPKEQQEFEKARDAANKALGSVTRREFHSSASHAGTAASRPPSTPGWKSWSLISTRRSNCGLTTAADCAHSVSTVDTVSRTAP